MVWRAYAVNHQQLCIHKILCHTLRPATPPLQPIQEEVPPEPEQMDMEILDDLPDIIHLPKDLLSDFDSWAHSALEYQW